MKFLFIALSVLISSMNVRAQSTEDSVKAVVNNLFTGMKNADAQLLRSCFADSAIMQTIATTKEGKTIIRNEVVSEFVDFVATQKKGAADERIEFGAVHIDGSLAIVWTPYKFFYQQAFSHCGVNSFHLVRLGGQWKIQYLIDTRRKTDCD